MHLNPLDEFYLNLCLQNAWQNQLLTLPNPAVSALVLDGNGAILSLESHKECGKPHAEVLALQKAYAILSKDDAILALEDSAQIHQYLAKNAKNLFYDSTIYVSLEPCSSQKCGKTPSCAALLNLLKPKRIVIGAKDFNPTAKGGVQELESHGIQTTKAWEITSLQPIAQHAKDLLIPFESLQKRGKFVLYKYACRLDGSINGGQISSKPAQSQMHNYRTKANYLLISGKSVRLDKPTLDSRFATLDSKRAPHVLILTRNQNFPKDAPLFGIPNREVRILHTLDFLLSSAPNAKSQKALNSLESLESQKPLKTLKFAESLESSNLGFVLCEGGAGLFKNMQPYIDMLLIILNPSFNADNTLTMRLQESFHFLHSMQFGEDLFLWLIPKR
ncbi:bifunctional diaminohydroxyphosphoribosylaminopyrimidine deaminase/5-amino-6-(5-phosphoribosylamino)uracil reductase RibD [Helicobacter sp. MIT 05-5294]|uniref:bifunctional diaminohydroxyphosphoribosylaminopyrimidine deaminase/5-amino-6-(5-phosphoribosylamino)uracil reductase RibD n=1 Tax=Helicobacter sp. MIT 05-5294 TaxID=1548150 RepID=UPI00051FAAEB|nr:bifunctional diaminohydroxyphosphoribosylaminopyrimidine deaminase/5-amino-6-(5-phosphoribosylamino)uracil reductase RibD [Helicobacter sp. MIT 05-5294]TLD89149.1 bifunctional diaminohydroxyphosphoribosylaminopyrimidine deaminase/5-amino-6-(5-phosphoribosylamino)uracil reductase RibD [Helicobacter sp. MIT 05-5294]